MHRRIYWSKDDENGLPDLTLYLSRRSLATAARGEFLVRKLSPLPHTVRCYTAQPTRQSGTDLVRRHRRPGADTERSQHDFHCQRAKDESHYPDEDGCALSTIILSVTESECTKYPENSRYCLGAREATIFSKSGSRRNGSHNGSNWREP